jgi:GntR family transcriptional repressor for pyruvate dehydrogenase complex
MPGSTLRAEEDVGKAIQTPRRYERIVEQIEQWILNGSMKPGDQLPGEHDLAQRFGVSRTAVREAAKALREKGLVEPCSGRGTFVMHGMSHVMRQSLDLMARMGQLDGSAHLGEVRNILEPHIAALAARRVEEQHLHAMREAFQAMDRNLDNAEAYIEADLDFHLALAEAAGNPLILSLLDSIVGLLREERIRLFRVNGAPQRSQLHHKRILQAVESRDAQAAREAMRAHLQQVQKFSSQ